MIERPDTLGINEGSPQAESQASTLRPSTASQAAKARRSKLKTSLIGAAIGGAAGGAAGLYAREATGGDVHPATVLGFAGAGAGIGAIVGFIVGLF